MPCKKCGFARVTRSPNFVSLDWLHPKFPERCHPFSCACAPDLVGIGRSRFAKVISKRL